MKKVKELFSRDIYRKIEEVVKVDQADEEIVHNELEEYVTTDALKNHYITVLDAYNETRTRLTEGIGIWISGFFGSGKSFFAKNLGYILSNRKVIDTSAADIFAEQVCDDKISNLLTIINKTIPTYAVIFDVS